MDVWSYGLQQELMFDHTVLLLSYHYHNNIELYDKEFVLKAMKKEINKLRDKDMYEEVDMSTLSQDQLRRVSKLVGLLVTALILLRLQLQLLEWIFLIAFKFI